MTRRFHVSPAANRASIAAHGLDWRRMSEPGIAGSAAPEVEGVFVCDEDLISFFVGFATDRAVDVWAVDGIADDELIDGAGGFRYLARRIQPEHLALHATDVTPPPVHIDPASGAYASILTITYDSDDQGEGVAP